MVKGFRCADTQGLFETGKSKRFANVAKVATRKLAQLDAANTLVAVSQHFTYGAAHEAFRDAFTTESACCRFDMVLGRTLCLLALVAQVGGKPDSTALRRRGIHQLPNRREDVNDRLIVSRELSFETVVLSRQGPVRFEYCADPHEPSHDLKF